MVKSAWELANEKHRIVSSLVELYENLHRDAPALYRVRELSALEAEAAPLIGGSDAEASIVEGLEHEIGVLSGYTDRLCFDRVATTSVGDVSFPEVLTTAGSAGTAIVSELHARILGGDSPSARSHTVRVYEKFRNLQEAHQSAQRVRVKLSSIRVERACEYVATREVVRRCINGTATHNEAGTAMRNLIQHLKGDLWLLVRRPNEQKSSWQTIAKRLAASQDSGALRELVRLSGQLEGGTETLWGKLSALLKQESDPGADQVEALFVQMESILLSLVTRLDWTRHVGER